MKQWNDKEIKFLQENYKEKGIAYCSNALNRSYNSVKMRACKLNIKTQTFEDMNCNLIDKTFGYLTVKELSHSKNRKKVWLCECQCGNTTKVITQYLKNGKIKSCGCYNKESTSKRFRSSLENKTFGRLKVLEYAYSKNKLVFWKTICVCGNTKYTNTASLVSGDTKSCGNCQLKRNGYSTSYKAIELHTMLYNKGIHNYKTNAGPIVDIALVKNGYKIAIEYDEWYWHGNRQEKDDIRIQKLIKESWKILSIKASNNLPSIEQLEEGIFKLISSNSNHIDIILPNWGTKLCL